MKKIVDAFIFYNELDLLEIRLEELKDVVDYFVIVEGTLTFTGKPKPLYYYENRERFAAYRDRIIHVVVWDYPTTDNPWDREIHQRRAISRGIGQLSLQPDDIILITDCDEIPNSQTLSMIKTCRFHIYQDAIYSIFMKLYYYTCEWTTDRPWDKAKLLSYQRYQSIGCDPERIRRYQYTIIEHGGWHLSYFGGMPRIIDKLESFSEQQDNTLENKQKLKQCMKDGILHFNEEKLTFVSRHSNTNLPRPLIRNTEKEIPCIGFTFWEGAQLSILHYLTLLSFSKYNPDFSIRVYYSNKEDNFTHLSNTSEKNKIHASGFNFGEDKCISIEQLKTIPRLEMIPIDVEKEYNVPFETSPIHKADMVRIFKLYEHGGIWFDMDVLFIKPVPEHLFSGVNDIYYFTYHNTIATGLIASTPRNPSITVIYQQCMDKVKSSTINNDWQQFGPTLWKQCVDRQPHTFKKCIYLDNNEIYPYMWNEPHLFFFTNENHIQSNTWGIHWYNGNIDSRKFIDTFTFQPDSIDSSLSVFHSCLADLYQTR